MLTSMLGKLGWLRLGLDGLQSRLAWKVAGLS
jgi:hypothetical protein